MSARYTWNVQELPTKETLETLEENRGARLGGKTGQYRKLNREAVRAVRRDHEAQHHGICEVVESHLKSLRLVCGV